MNHSRSNYSFISSGSVLIAIMLFMLAATPAAFPLSPAFSKSVLKHDSSGLEIGKLITFAEQFLGTPYKYAGKDPRGFDCSGFVYYVFGQFGLKLPASSVAMDKAGSEIARRQARPGDLILFTGTNLSIRQTGHVGIITEVSDDDIRFIHSSSGKSTWGVVYSQLSQANYTRRFLKIVRVVQ
jgi:cell wall-associated NlpC family hydrolase